MIIITEAPPPDDTDKVAITLQALIDARAELSLAKRPMQIRYLQQDVFSLQSCLAAMFGQRRGWHLSRSDFSPTVLARNGLFDGRGHHAEYWPRELVDHGYFYRKDRLAVAVASHLYGAFPDAKRQDLEACAAELGLKVEWPEDFPSWWVPGGTTLVVYTAAKDGKLT